MKLLITSLFLVLGSLLYSQGNLQFNQVVNLSPGNSYTVPAGKVLKIESINIGSNSICIPRSNTINANCYSGYGYEASSYGQYTSISYLSIGDMIFSTPTFNSNGGGNSCQSWTNPNCWNYSFSNLTFSLPIWLAEGKNVIIHSGAASIHITGIEFNIIP